MLPGVDRGSRRARVAALFTAAIAIGNNHETREDGQCPQIWIRRAAPGAILGFPMPIHSCLFAALCVLLCLGCGSSEPAASPEAEATSGADATAAEAASADPSAQDESASDAQQAPTPDPLQELQGKVIQLGVNRAALERTLEGPQVSCERAEGQRDRICSLTDEICAGAEQAPQAQPQCDNARGKCEAAKADVARVRCKG